MGQLLTGVSNAKYSQLSPTTPIMNAAKELRKTAKNLGWKILSNNGKHQIWVSLSGHKMPLPGTPSSRNRSRQNIKSKLRKYA